MKCQGSAGELVKALWDESAKHTKFHPHDALKKDRLLAFLDGFERLDSEIFFSILEYLRGPEQRSFKEACLALREVL